jgi:hypothetical protein
MVITHASSLEVRFDRQMSSTKFLTRHGKRSIHELTSSTLLYDNALFGAIYSKDVTVNECTSCSDKSQVFLAAKSGQNELIA